MKIVADLHLHSKYSRAVSPQMVIPEMAKWAKIKGINLLGTGDFTHPLWIRELETNLEEKSEGVYKLKNGNEEVLFLLATEISSIYSQGGRVRKIHNLIIAPSFTAAKKINQELARRGANLMADGRPIVGLSAKEILEIILSVDKSSLIIPAHIWTPHFSLFGSESGFDTVEECFGNLAQYIYGIETGLSSSPAMNWAVADLDNRGIVSFSDAHSLENLGREVTVLESEMKYGPIREAIAEGKGIKSTIEFYPEEGKYHYTGHRNCKVVFSPAETKKKGTICPVCGKRLTVGVMERVEKLGVKDRVRVRDKNDEWGNKWVETDNRAPFIKLVPLREILAEVKGVGKQSQAVASDYQRLIGLFGSEFKLLTETPVASLITIGEEKLAEGIMKVRSGDIFIRPGFDGEYGKVSIWGGEARVNPVEQISLF